MEEKQVDPSTTLLWNVKTFFTDQHIKSKIDNTMRKESKSKRSMKSRISKKELYKIKLQERKEANIKKKDEEKLLILKQIHVDKQKE